MATDLAASKKIFFLNPPPVLAEVAEELAKQEFEVYLVHDHKKIRTLLTRHGESILFVNIDKPVEGTRWESFIHEILNDASCSDVGVGVMTMTDIDPEIREKFLMQLQVPCGYVVLKVGVAKTIEILTKTLDANEARRKRKHVRAICPPGTGQCNVEIDGMMAYGDIRDISSAGMAVVFHGSSGHRVGTVLSKISIVVKNVRLIVDGFVSVQRPGENGSMIHVVMFIPSSLDEQRINKLRILVYRLNQHVMDAELLAIN